jgi:hypothetical protein
MLAVFQQLPFKSFPLKDLQSSVNQNLLSQPLMMSQG